MRNYKWATPKHDRSQLMLMSPSLDDTVPPEHQVRAFEAVLLKIDWSRWEAKYNTGRGQPPIHPMLVAGILLWGLKNGIQSSRILEEATKLRIDFMWFLHGRTIDHSTIAGFRTRFGKELPDLFNQFARLALNGNVNIELGIDGTRVRADSSRTGALTAEGIERRAADVAKQLTEALEKMERNDLLEDSAKASPEEIERHIHRLQSEQEKLSRALEQARERDVVKSRKGDSRRAASTRVPVTDPDAHVLKNKEGGYAPNYTPTIAVDLVSGAIVAADVPPGSSEASVVADAVAAATELSGNKPVAVLFDSAFATGANLEHLSKEGVKSYSPAGVKDAANPAVRADLSLPVPPELWKKLPTWGRKKRVLTAEAFIYDEQNDCYWCPMGRKMAEKHLKKNGKGEVVEEYLCEDCSKCPMSSKCLSRNAKRRRVSRDRYEVYREENKERMNTDEGRQIYSRRAPYVEGSFGHIKNNMDIRHFLLRGRKKVTLEWLWICSAYNLSKILRRAGAAAIKGASALSARLDARPDAAARPVLHIMSPFCRRLAA